MVEERYEDTKGVRTEISELSVKVVLRQGSAISPLLFIAVMEGISRKMSTRDKTTWLAVADSKADFQQRMVEWNMFGRN